MRACICISPVILRSDLYDSMFALHKQGNIQRRAVLLANFTRKIVANCSTVLTGDLLDLVRNSVIHVVCLGIIEVQRYRTDGIELCAVSFSVNEEEVEKRMSEKLKLFNIFYNLSWYFSLEWSFLCGRVLL